MSEIIKAIELNKKKKKMIPIFVDLETTDLNTATAGIIELAAEVCPQWLKSINVQVSQPCFYSRVKPYCEISAQASQVHGIYAKDVDNASSFTTVYLEFQQYCQRIRDESKQTQSCILLIAHNNFRFDRLIFENEIKRHGITSRIPNYKYADTLYVLHTKFGIPKGQLSLALLVRDVCNKPNHIPTHCSKDDVRNLIEVVTKLNNQALMYSELMKTAQF